MRKDNLILAIHEAKRFLYAATTLQGSRDVTSDDTPWVAGPSPLAAATKRASMDLTKSLAALRRPE
jgi:hypothetical protein